MNDYRVWLFGIGISILLLIALIIQTVIQKPQNGLAHILLGVGLTLMVSVRSLGWMGKPGTNTLIMMLFIGELAIAVGIFFLRPDNPGYLVKQSILSRVNLCMSLGIVATMMLLAFFVIKVFGPPEGGVRMEIIVGFIGLIPIIAALIFKFMHNRIN
ncbi:MAG: hypothetical protein ACYC0V_15710 [Armatimonadota bacterium]